jgi:hypothetical protein
LESSNVGASEPCDDKGVLVYPMPSSNEVNVRLSTFCGDKVSSISVYDVMGIKRKEWYPSEINIFQSEFVADIADLDEGMFLVSVKFEHQTVVKKIVRLNDSK